jgi:hypothetical protein
MTKNGKNQDSIKPKLIRHPRERMYDDVIKTPRSFNITEIRRNVEPSAPSNNPSLSLSFCQKLCNFINQCCKH